jgi:hypothetical protein
VYVTNAVVVYSKIRRDILLPEMTGPASLHSEEGVYQRDGEREFTVQDPEGFCLPGRPDRLLQRTSQTPENLPPFPIRLDLTLLCYAQTEYSAMQSVSNCRTLKRPVSRLCMVSNQTRLFLIPPIGGEFIATILGRESNVPLDLQTDFKSATENSLPAPRSRSDVSETPVPTTFQWKVSWLRCSRLFAVVARLVL